MNAKCEGGDNMKKTQKILIASSISLVFLVITGVYASSGVTHTPLHTIRMEQVSSDMNFLPVEMNDFTYTTGQGCTIVCDTGQSSNGAYLFDTGTCCMVTCDFVTCELPCHTDIESCNLITCNFVTCVLPCT